jgi:indole-3-glycerol phosphate synthase
MERALGLKAQLIGINNRNLKSLTVDLATTERLAPMVPSARILVSESGLAKPDDLGRMAKAGAHCFLIGESLMREADVEQATRDLLRAPVAETVGA